MTCHNNIFCEQCGDCLECYSEDPCFDGGPHQWPSPEVLESLTAATAQSDIVERMK